MTDQPPPQPPPPGSPGVDIMAELEAEVRARAATGRRVYGVTLQAFNGRDQLKDARDEAIDLAAYLTAEMHERDALRADLDKANEITLDVMRERDVERQRADAAYDRAIRLEAERDELRGRLAEAERWLCSMCLSALSGPGFDGEGCINCRLDEAERERADTERFQSVDLKMWSDPGWDRVKAAAERMAAEGLEAERTALADMTHSAVSERDAALQQLSSVTVKLEATDYEREAFKRDAATALTRVCALEKELLWRRERADEARALLEEAPSPDYPEEWPRWYAKRHAFLAPTPPAEPRARVTDLEEAAWGIIANAGGGDWDTQRPEWRDAAVRWREEYHAKLGVRPAPAEPKPLSKTQRRTLALQRGEPLPAEAQPVKCMTCGAGRYEAESIIDGECDACAAKAPPAPTNSECGRHCYIIGGPWIAEDPDCPVHSKAAAPKKEGEE